MKFLQIFNLTIVCIVFSTNMISGSACFGQDEKWPVRKWTIAAEVSFRKFTDSTGRFNTEAKFVQLVDGTVELRQPDGRELLLPLEKLSKEDQAYINERGKPTSVLSGKEIRAQYIGVKENRVELLAETGEALTIATNRLSAKDRAYLKFLKRKTISDVEVDGFLDAIEKTDSFIEDLKRQKVNNEQAKESFKKFKKTLPREVQKNAFVICYLAAGKVDFILKPDGDFRTLMRNYPDFWLAWRVFIVSELVNSGARPAITALKRYQDVLVNEYEIRPANADNADIGIEFEWVNDTAQQFVSFQNGSAANLQKISENALAFDIGAKIKFAAEYRKLTKAERAALDAENAEIRAEQLRKLTEQARSEFASMRAVLKEQSDKLKADYDLASAKVVGLQLPLQESSRALSFVRSQISSVQSSISSCQSSIDSENNKDEPEESRLDSLDRDLSNYNQQLSQLNYRYSGLQRTYLGILTEYRQWYFQLQRTYYRICELTNYARNKGRMFVVQFKEAITNDSSLQTSVDDLEQQVGFWISRLPKMPVFISNRQIDEHETKKEELRVAKDILISLADLKEGLIALTKKREVVDANPVAAVNEKEAQVIEVIKPFTKSSRSGSVTVPEGTGKIEISLFRDGVSEYKHAGKGGNLSVNDRMVVKFVKSYTSGGRRHNLFHTFNGVDVNTRLPETVPGMFDITEFAKPGDKLNISYRHQLTSPAIGVKIRFTPTGSTTKE